MAMHGQVLGDEAAESGESLFGKVVAAVRWFAAWMDACAEYRGSAALYEQLSRLSDDELHKRGLTRESLARYAIKLRD